MRRLDENYKMMLAGDSCLLDAGDMIEELMVKQGIGREDLARRAETSLEYINQLIDGDRSRLTLRTLSNIMYVLDARLQISFKMIDQEKIEI